MIMLNERPLELYAKGRCANAGGFLRRLPMPAFWTMKSIIAEVKLVARSRPVVTQLEVLVALVRTKSW